MNNRDYNAEFADLLDGLDLDLEKDSQGYILYDCNRNKAYIYDETFKEYEDNTFCSYEVSDYKGIPDVTANDVYEAIPKSFIEDRYWSEEGIAYEFKRRFKDTEWNYHYSELTMQGWLDFAQNNNEVETTDPCTIKFADCYIIKEFDLIQHHLDEIDIDEVYRLMHPEKSKEMNRPVKDDYER